LRISHGTSQDAERILLRDFRRLQNPRIARIGFKTLRHFKASMEYHKTKDILYVMCILGHKDILIRNNKTLQDLNMIELIKHPTDGGKWLVHVR
jgi:integrase